MSNQTPLFIPRIAWPALTQFAPERFPELQLRFDSPETGSEQMKLVRAELETLVRDFRAWAVGFLRRERDAALLAAGQHAQIQRQLEQKYWAKHFAALAQADLTTTEKERLMRHLSKHNDRPVKPVLDALKALAKPWRHREPKFN